MAANKMHRLALGTAGAAALVVAAAGVASAHVTVNPGEAEAGSYAVLTFSVPHGCDGSATTEIAIRIPEQTPAVTPTANPNWDVEKVMVEQDDAPERVGQVVYTARTPLPDGMRDTFELSMLMPDSPGETLAFPVVQTCEEGDTAWVEVVADGEDPHSLDAPAPLVTLTAPASGDGHDATAKAAAGSGSADETNDASGEEHGTGETTSAAAEGGNGSGDGLAIAGLAAGVLGIALGGTALARAGRRT